MALGDFLDPEVAVAVAVTAALTSPRVRGLVRRGAVYGLAGLLTASDALASFARDAAQGAPQTGASAAATAQEAVPRPGAAADGEEPTTGDRRQTTGDSGGADGR